MNDSTTFGSLRSLSLEENISMRGSHLGVRREDLAGIDLTTLDRLTRGDEAKLRSLLRRSCSRLDRQLKVMFSVVVFEVHSSIFNQPDRE